ncbi:hypothetical protein ABPG73_012580 [Tetrahymena malaccensis]
MKKRVHKQKNIYNHSIELSQQINKKESGMFNFRQKVWITLIIFIWIFFANTQDRQIANGWITGAVIFSAVLIIDLLFTGSNSFLYEPEYSNWKERVEKGQGY